MNGTALPEGTKVIFMHPTSGHAGYGLTDATGAYRIEWRREGSTYDGLPVGKYQIMLVPSDTVDVEELSADEMLAGGAPAKNSAKNAISAKYQRAATSGLEFDVVEGENVANLEIGDR